MIIIIFIVIWTHPHMYDIILTYITNIIYLIFILIVTYFIL